MLQEKENKLVELDTRLELTRKELESRIAQNARMAKEYEAEIEALNTQVDKGTQRLHEVLGELRLCKENLLGSQGECQQLREDVEMLVEMKDKLSQTLMHEQNQRESLCETMRRSRIETNHEYHHKIEEMERENGQLVEENQQLRFDLQLAAEKLHATENRCKEQLSGARQEVDKIRADNRKLVDGIHEEQKRAEKLNVDASIFKERMGFLEKEVDRLGRLEKIQNRKLQVSARELEDTRTNLASAEALVSEKDQTIECIKEEIGALADRFQDTLAKKQKTYSQNLFEKDQVLERLRKKCAQLTRQLETNSRVVKDQAHVLKNLDQSLDRMIM